MDLLKAWLANYPMWRTNRDAWHTCKLVADLIAERAESAAVLGTVDDHVTYLCHRLGIPRTQFDEVEGCSRELRSSMILSLARNCPACGAYLSLWIGESLRHARARSLNGLCRGCGYRLAWSVIDGNSERKGRWPRNGRVKLINNSLTRSPPSSSCSYKLSVQAANRSRRIWDQNVDEANT